MNRRPRRAGGLTLVEFAATVALVAVALVGTAAAVAMAAGLSRTTAETRAASRATASLMERIRATPFDQIMATYNGTTTAVSALGEYDSSGAARVTVTELDTGSTRWKVYQVTLDTTWKGVSGNRAVRFTTYVCDRTAGSELSSPSTLGTGDNTVR